MINKPTYTLRQLILYFLKLGATGFGGPLVTIHLMKEAFVRKLEWISEREFLERMGKVKLLPGPVSSLMAIAYAGLKQVSTVTADGIVK